MDPKPEALALASGLKSLTFADALPFLRDLAEVFLAALPETEREQGKRILLDLVLGSLGPEALDALADEIGHALIRRKGSEYLAAGLKQLIFRDADERRNDGKTVSTA